MMMRNMKTAALLCAVVLNASAWAAPLVKTLPGDGVIVGSIGVSGGSVDEDESVAKAGAAALPER